VPFDRLASVNFGAWLPVDETPVAAPDLPGVLQARAATLLPYPRGKSAMVLYARCRPDETLRRYLDGRGSGALDRAVTAGARYVRFATSQMPDLEFDRLLRRFVDRFGGVPAANLGTDEEAPRDHA
jgi:hypothetical protein